MHSLVLAAGFTDVKPGLMFWTLVTFILVAFILRRVAWRPILQAVDEREKQITSSIDAAKKERAEAEKLLGEQKTAIAAARQEAADMMRKNQSEMDRFRDELMGKARQEVEELKQAADRGIRGREEQGGGRAEGPGGGAGDSDRREAARAGARPGEAEGAGREVHLRAAEEVGGRAAGLSGPWVSPSASSACPTWASRPSSTRCRTRARWRPTTRSPPSSRTSAWCRCPTSGSTSSPRWSSPRRRSTPRSSSSTSPGLVRGASKGEGLGNQFLANIRQVDAVLYVLRCFVDDNITHVEGSVDPLRDKEVVDTELCLKDLETVEKRRDKTSRSAKAPGKEGELAKAELAAARQGEGQARPGHPGARARAVGRRAGAHRASCSCSPTSRCSTSPTWPRVSWPRRPTTRTRWRSGAGHRAPKEKRRDGGAGGRRWRREIQQLPQARSAPSSSSRRASTEPGLNKVVRAGYKLLGLQTYFTVGPKECRAWTIHTGLEGAAGGGRDSHRLREGLHQGRGLLLEGPDRAAAARRRCARRACLRMEGKEYVVQDGDCMHFRFNVTT